ncbi:MAG TPA: T9SS type A sorting domain-containing protein [Bacteroidota bacterium]|nr:T9SS type A sorting domain-containing protein [Bacteroidota bacterium]
MKYIALLVSCLILLSGNLFAQAIVDGFVARSHTYMGTTLPYRLFIPANYSSAQKYPVVLCLHGSGEAGTDNVSQLTIEPTATVWADPANQAKYPCFVVAPQYPSGGTWSLSLSLPIRPELAVANNILDSLAREFSIDTNRFYVTGLSDGGFGSWDIIIRFPGRFAAAIPMSGGADPAYADSCVGVPIWDFHGAIDAVVPVQYSRVMIDALHSLGRSVVYTNCHNLDCTGLADSTIAMYVQSHADLFYTEFQNTGHTPETWSMGYNYPYLFPWVFDKYKKRPGAITLSNLKSHRVLSGIAPITWSSSAPGDSVELWFSSDAGTTWRALQHSAPNTGTFLWNTSLAPDCAFGVIQVFLKDSGFIVGSDRSSFLAIDNHGTGPPFVSLQGDEFTTGAVFDQDSVDLSLLAGDPEGAPLSASVDYSADGGKTFGQFDSYTANPDTLWQTRRIGIRPLPNSPQAVIELIMNDGHSLSQAKTFPFAKITPRLAGSSVTHTAGTGAATVTVHVLTPSAVTGDRYQITFQDSTGVGKQYAVRDIDRSTDVVQHATALDGVTEGPLFDGIRLVIKDVPVPYVNSDSTRWVKGSATMHVHVYVPRRVIGPSVYQGVADPFDFKLTLFSTIVDTSKAGFGVNATPMKFMVWNLTTNTKADVAYYDANGNNTIGSFDEVDIIEPDTLGKPRLSWAMLFVAEAGDTLPVPGDEFLLKTVKGVTAADVYQFTATVTSIARSTAPQTFSLEQNYPNPFNPSTTIRYSLGRAAHVRLTVFSLLGQQVATVVNGEQEAGSHEVKFDGRNFASGVYFYRLQAGSFAQTKKLMILK